MDFTEQREIDIYMRRQKYIGISSNWFFAIFDFMSVYTVIFKTLT